ncbi:MAG: pyridoxine 5'-phosphate synthase [Verrucomicrobiota bacterium]
MLKLGVNIDHVATLREARYRGAFSHVAEPDVISVANACVEAGAHSITTHLREDRRHIQVGDVLTLRHNLKIALNLEMAATEPMIDFALRLKPEEVCIVPENREELTTEGGLDIWRNTKRIAACVRRLSQEGILISLFVDPEVRAVHNAAEVEAKCVELHTGRLANAASDSDREKAIEELIQASQAAHEQNIQVNAGHGLNYKNIAQVLRVPHLHTLNIGHSIVSRAILAGMERAVKDMLNLMKNYDK